MTRDEFRRVVKKLQDEGKPLSMANLMLRTELPRAQIERLLEEVQSDASVDMPSSKADKGKSKGKSARARDDEDDEDDDEPDSLQEKARSLKNELIGVAVKAQLGIKDRDKDDGPKELATVKKSVQAGTLVGLLFPPAALAYAAPWKMAIPATVGYLALAWLVMGPLSFIPAIPGVIMLVMHLAGAFMGGGYAWRFNRKGERAELFADGDGGGRKKKKKRARSDDDDE